MRRNVFVPEHPFGTIKARMGATHFLMKRLFDPDGPCHMDQSMDDNHPEGNVGG